MRIKSGSSQLSDSPYLSPTRLIVSFIEEKARMTAAKSVVISRKPVLARMAEPQIRTISAGIEIPFYREISWRALKHTH